MIMKKFASLLVGSSLAVAGAVWAQQQPDAQESPSKGNKRGTEKTTQTQTQGAEPRSGKHANARANPEANPNTNTNANPNANPNATNPEGTTGAKQHGAGKHERGNAAKNQRQESTSPTSGASPETGASVSGQPAASTTAGGKHQGGKHERGNNARGQNANAAASATPATSTSTNATAAPSVSATGQQPNATGQQNARGVNKADPQKVQQVKAQAQQIKSQHANFKAEPRPDRVPAVSFNQNYRIEGAERWQGPQYEVFRSYHPERHDQGWYRSHYNRVELIGGGYYYWNGGYWYPAWGYDSGHEYYAYDAPIYVGHRTEPPDRVIADVQTELQQMGYYQGEVDGLLGPQTRQALTSYQADQGLATTAVIDEPTLDSLGMA
jgi:hypothetical protein